MTDVLYFSAYDSKDGGGLWVSDGTVDGTVEIGGLDDAGVAGVSTSGLSPDYTIAFGNDLLFAGRGGDGSVLSPFDDGLWISNGTPGGTYEIGGLYNAGVVGSYSSGLYPNSFTVFGSKALFFGTDSGGYQGLWVTDGTAAGTIELGGLHNAGIAGAYFNGIANYTDASATFGALPNAVIFTGLDSNDYFGLWVTNGTTAGTVEIGGLKNAGIAGNPGSTEISDCVSFDGEVIFTWGADQIWITNGTVAGTIKLGLISNAAATVVGGSAYFEGLDDGLWVTNGTVAGTVELGGAASLGIAGSWQHFGFGGLYPRDITAFGTEAVFQAQDNDDDTSLWITNGTVVGTFEIGGLGNAGLANVGSLGLDPYNFTSIGSKILFEGEDASGQDTLWVTNGTVTGTFEIGGLNNSAVVGAPRAGLDPEQIYAVGNIAFFKFEDSTGNTEIWVTDGTTAGTHELTGISGADSTYFAPEFVAQSSVNNTGDDFLNNGKSDILIENTSGAVVVGELGSNGQETYAQVAGLGPQWTFDGDGDFFGQGHTQFLIENSSGALVVGALVGVSTTYYQIGALGPEWSFEGTGDYLDDGKSDFLIENTSGALVVGEIGPNGQAAYTEVGALGAEWTFEGAGNFIGDGKTDFLIKNTAGAVVVGEIFNGQATYTQVGALGPEWKFVGDGDFLGDGKDQFLIENTSGAVVLGQLGSSNQATYAEVGVLGPEWSFVGAGDYSGTGKDSFLIENTAGSIVTGTIVSGQAQYAQVGALGSIWKFHS